MINIDTGISFYFFFFCSGVTTFLFSSKFLPFFLSSKFHIKMSNPGEQTEELYTHMCICIDIHIYVYKCMCEELYMYHVHIHIQICVFSRITQY